MLQNYIWEKRGKRPEDWGREEEGPVKRDNWKNIKGEKKRERARDSYQSTQTGAFRSQDKERLTEVS